MRVQLAVNRRNPVEAQRLIVGRWLIWVWIVKSSKWPCHMAVAVHPATACTATSARLVYDLTRFLVDKRRRKAQTTTTARTFNVLQRRVLQALVDLLASATINRRIMTLSTTLDSSAN